MKIGRINDVFDEENVKAHRKFPTGSTILLSIIVIVQIALIVFGFNYTPQPLDEIREYTVTVEPLSDGSLDIEYHFLWKALDDSEALTWVEIGMPNDNFTVYPDSLSPTISDYNEINYDDYVYLDIFFHNVYYGGDMVEFSFKVNQKDMLCYSNDGYFYEFVPCWFNAIKVKNYEFVWLMDEGENYVKRGSLDYGEYVKMKVAYDKTAFVDCETVGYVPFDDSGAYDEMQEDKNFAIAFCIVVAALLILAEVYIIDCYVSYNRGRGFLSGHGYYVHTYGGTNAHYIRARDRYNATHASGRRFGGGGGGCACACACACAGGGRAGCSQKDTFGNSEYTDKKDSETYSGLPAKPEA